MIAFFAATLLIGALTGCNTMRGAGEDVESAGSAVKDAAN